MINQDIISIEWLKESSKKNNKADTILMEKVIRALLLLEGLVESELDFIFKGGTAVMLLQSSSKRFSIDIDIIAPKRVAFEKHFDSFLKTKGFTKYKLQNRQTNSDIEKLHYKFFYPSVNSGKLDFVLLDILVEEPKYQKIINVNIDSLVVPQSGAPLQVKAPSIDDIVADKLTAFAPNTTGIPYEKNGVSRSMEIIKQLFDIGNLFEGVEDLNVLETVYRKIAKIELKYRQLPEDVDSVLDDTFETALCISTRGVLGAGNFEELQNGIKRINPYIFPENYHLDKAIVHTSRVAYLAELIKRKATTLLRFKNPLEIKDWLIEDPLDSKLNKLKKSNPEAFFYWYQVYVLRKNNNG